MPLFHVRRPFSMFLRVLIIPHFRFLLPSLVLLMPLMAAVTTVIISMAKERRALRRDY